MAFTRGQHAHHYRPMIARAAKKRGLNPKDRKALDLWIRTELHEWCGVWSTNELNPHEDFEFVMARLEEMIGGDIYWQMRYKNGSARRLIHRLTQICRERDIDEDYARGVARNALGLETLPLFEEMSPKQLRTLVQIFSKQAGRIATCAAESNEPF
jgi:hypothetical protein